MKAAISAIDNLNERVGRVVSWLTLTMVLLQFAIVLFRYIFGIGWIAAQEAIVYMHATVFLSLAGYTLRHDGHVRVDIFYGSASPRGKAWVNLFGVMCFLLPMATAIFILSWPYVMASWKVLEGSPEGGNGIPGVFLLKSLILVFAALIILQGLALAAKSVAFLSGNTPPPLEDAESNGQGV